jgi:dihydroflavonol-4-reductase
MYVVTGATGHIGNNVVRYLIEQGERVSVLVRQVDHSLTGLSVESFTHSNFDEHFLDSNIHENDIVIHSAGFIDLLNRDKMNTFRTNYQLTKRIADLCLKKKVRLIYISSVDVIPKHKNGVITEPIDFNFKTDPRYYYKTSKALATKYVFSLMKKGLNGMVLYPSAVIGPHDYKPSAAGKEILHVAEARILFSLKGGYNFIDVRDVAKAIYVASKLDLVDHIIISGYQKKIRELYESIEKVTRKQKFMIPLPMWLVRLAIIFTPNYTNVMVNSIRENYNYSQDKMKKYLLDDLIPYEQTIQDTLSWLTKKS